MRYVNNVNNTTIEVLKLNYMLDFEKPNICNCNFCSDFYCTWTSEPIRGGIVDSGHLLFVHC